MNLNMSLEDAEKMLAQHKNLQDYIDETGEVFVTAGVLLSLLIAPNPVSAIAALGLGSDVLAFKFSKFFGWLPDKLNYWNKGKKETVVERYEKALLVNTIVFHIALRDGVNKTLADYVQWYATTIKTLSKSGKYDLSSLENRLLKEGARIDDQVRRMVLAFNENNRFSHQQYIKTICKPFVEELIDKIKTDDDVDAHVKGKRVSKLIDDVVQEVLVHYNASLIHLSNKFPEFAVMVDLHNTKQVFENQEKILKQLKKGKPKNKGYVKLQEMIEGDIVEIQEEFVQTLKLTLKEIKELRDLSFHKNFGFEKLIGEQDFISRKMDDLTHLYKENKLSNIEAHHNQIRRKLDECIVDNEDIESIVYPKNKEIFVPQSFRTISYNRAEHQKHILLDSFWVDEDMVVGENVGKFIMNELTLPSNSFKPIVILGNPGAGKSMLSSILSARLCESTDFVPFFIRLRDVVMSDTNPKNHINEGIRNTLEGNVAVDWISWAKEFSNRIPVIVLDGFDELLRASQAEINNYVSKLQDLLVNVYKDYNISARIILTSRLTVMQDVEIPERTRIIRLDSFDEKRRAQWVERWNNFQTHEDFLKFDLPDSKSIQDLAKEPLLLFMLAVYDYENSELQNDLMEQDFNQSKLYHKLFNKFTHRQLDKDPKFAECSLHKKEQLSKKYRLRLGAISALMFLNDLDHKETQQLVKELASFGIGGDDTEPSLIFKGFFFVHKDKSTEVSGFQSYTFEFIHKSFGEFLAADFLVRVFLERFEDEEIEKLSSEDAMRFCLGYNWLHKHYNITRFLFEHAENLVKENRDVKRGVIKIIKSELKQILGTKINLFPISDFSLIPGKPVLEHLAIYSQNLILLWVAINKSDPFSFNLFGDEEAVQLSQFNFESQDRTEVNLNKVFWKKITKLWELNGNRYAIAKLKEWVKVAETEENIKLCHHRGEIVHNFSDSAIVACNDYEVLLSYSDNPLSLLRLHEIYDRKPELRLTCIRLLNDKFDFFFRQDEKHLYKIATKFIQSRVASPVESMRLLENLHVHYLSLEGVVGDRSINKGVFLSPEMVTQSTGNFSGIGLSTFKDQDMSKWFKHFSADEIDQMGINRYLKFLQSSNREYLADLDTDGVSKMVEVKLPHLLKEASDQELLSYLWCCYKMIIFYFTHRNVRFTYRLVVVVFRKLFERFSVNKTVDSSVLEYLQIYILCRIFISKTLTKKAVNELLPNSIIETIFYDFKLPFIGNNSDERYNFEKSLQFLELLVIAVNNQSVKINIDSKKVEYIVDGIHSKTKRRHDTDQQYQGRFARYFDLLSILLSVVDESPQTSIIKNAMGYYSQEYFLKKTTMVNIDRMRFLKFIVDNESIFTNKFLAECFKSASDSSKKLRDLSTRQQIQFTMLLNKSKVAKKLNWDSINEVVNGDNGKTLKEFKTDLTFFNIHNEDFFPELTNIFYYEKKHMDTIPHFLLRRSILHRDLE